MNEDKINLHWSKTSGIYYPPLSTQQHPATHHQSQTGGIYALKLSSDIIKI